MAEHKLTQTEKNARMKILREDRRNTAITEAIVKAGLVRQSDGWVYGDMTTPPKWFDLVMQGKPAP